MISATQLWLSFVISLVSAGMGMGLAIKYKKIDRQKIKNVGIWVFLGLTSFLLVLMANAVNIDWGYVDEVLISLVYSYFMADAAMFSQKD